MKPKHPKASKFVRSGFFKGIRTFDRLENKITALPETDRGMVFEVFVEAWLNVIRKGKDVLPSNAIRPTLHKKLKLAGKSTREIGWDGVFIDHNGEYVIYQAKFRSGKTKLSWTELATSFAATKRCPYPLCIITNLDRVTSDADNENYFLIGKSVFRNLKAADFTAIDKWLKGVQPKPVKLTRRPYQRKAVKSVIDEFKKVDRTQAIMACGTGKTLVAKWISDDLKSKRTLVLLPSLALLRQTFKEWSINSDLKDAAYICVCSEGGITQGADELVFKATELEFPVTTDATELRALLKKHEKKNVVVFSTYHSSEVVGKASGRLYPFEFGVFDEAHKTAAKQLTKFRHALGNKNIRIDKRLFMTATPRVINVSSKNKEGEFDVSSMDDPAVYGERSYRMSFPEAVKLGKICDYKIIISVITRKDVDRALLKKGEVIRKKDIIRAQQVAHQLALKDAMRRFRLKKMFTFHGSIRAAKSFVAESAEGIQEHIKDLECFHVNGAMPSTEREAILDDLVKSKRGLISNARCLTEGVNLPSVDCVAFIDPRSSKVDIVQAVGRAMRKDPANPKKKCGYVFIPLYVEQKTGESAEDAVERSDYKSIVSVLSAMRDHDEDLEEIITAMGVERGLKPKGIIRGKMFGGKVAVIGPTVGFKRLEKSIMTKVADDLIISWDEMFGVLLRFKRKEGHTRVLRSHSDTKLSNWVNTQRHLRRKGKLFEDKIRLLDEIEFDWNPDETFWNEMYMSLKAYKKTEGHCRVPKDFPKNPKLGIWVDGQRSSRKTGKLSEDKIVKLNTIGFIWDPYEDNWIMMYNELEKFWKKNGHCIVPHVKKGEGSTIWNWANTQRVYWKEGRLSDEKISKLDRIGFIWNRYGLQWEEKLRELEDFNEKEGHFHVPRTNRQLGAWPSKQRNLRKKGKLSKEKIRKLDEIGFDWDPVKSHWDSMLRELKAFKRKEGHCFVPQDYTENPQFGIWVGTQRARYKNGAISKEEFTLLDQLGFIWDPLDAQWAQMYEVLKIYRMEEGHCLVPRSHENKLRSNWVLVQRTTKRKGKMAGDRIKLLNKIGFDWDPIESKWNEMYEALKGFHSKEGHCLVPKIYLKNPALGNWADGQRTNYSKNILEKNKIKKLDQLGFVWAIKEAFWDEMYKALKLFQQKNGHARVPLNFVENPKLGIWVATQRSRHKRGTISEKEIKKLNKLRFDWRLRS